MSTNGDDEFRVPLPQDELICRDCHGLTGKRETCQTCKGRGLVVPPPGLWWNIDGEIKPKPRHPFAWKSRDGKGHRWNSPSRPMEP